MLNEFIQCFIELSTDLFSELENRYLILRNLCQKKLFANIVCAQSSSFSTLPVTLIIHKESIHKNEIHYLATTKGNDKVGQFLKYLSKNLSIILCISTHVICTYIYFKVMLKDKN